MGSSMPDAAHDETSPRSPGVCCPTESAYGERYKPRARPGPSAVRPVRPASGRRELSRRTRPTSRPSLASGLRVAKICPAPRHLAKEWSYGRAADEGAGRTSPGSCGMTPLRNIRAWYYRPGETHDTDASPAPIEIDPARDGPRHRVGHREVGEREIGASASRCRRVRRRSARVRREETAYDEHAEQDAQRPGRRLVCRIYGIWDTRTASDAGPEAR